MRFRFGDLALDTDRFLLERHGQAVHVQPQVFDVLSHLVSNRERVVPKTELLDTVWGDRFVSESTLTSRIKAARRVVGDDGIGQTVLKTIHGRGYRWVAEVDVEEKADQPPAAARSSAPRAADPVLPGSRRCTGRVRHGRRRAAVGSSGALDHPPRLRLEQPGVAAL